MFRNISWANYGIFILITLVVYYATIGCLYYLNEIKQLFTGKSSFVLKLSSSKKFATNNINSKVCDSNAENFNQANNSSANFAVQSDNELPPSVYEYINEVKNLLEYASNNNSVKQEIIYSFQQLSKRYSFLKSSPFKEYVTNYILNECNNYSSIHLDEDEMKMIWAN